MPKKELNKKEEKKIAGKTKSASSTKLSKSSKTKSKLKRNTASAVFVKASEKQSPKKVSIDMKSDDMERKSVAKDTSSVSGGRSLRVHKATVIIAIVIVLLGVFLYFGRGLFVAAVVNGQPISRLEVVNEAEKTSGAQVMSSLIRYALVEQEAKKEKVEVTDKDIDKQIKTIEENLKKSGQNIDQMLELQGMTKEDLKKIVRLDLLVTKLIEKDIKISDKDVDDYIEKYRDEFPEDMKEDELKKEAREQLKQSMLPQKAQSWFADLEKKANIIKFVNY